MLLTLLSLRKYSENACVELALKFVKFWDANEWINAMKSVDDFFAPNVMADPEQIITILVSENLFSYEW